MKIIICNLVRWHANHGWQQSLRRRRLLIEPLARLANGVVRPHSNNDCA